MTDPKADEAVERSISIVAAAERGDLTVGQLCNGWTTIAGDLRAVLSALAAARADAERLTRERDAWADDCYEAQKRETDANIRRAESERECQRLGSDNAALRAEVERLRNDAGMRT